MFVGDTSGLPMPACPLLCARRAWVSVGPGRAWSRGCGGFGCRYLSVRAPPGCVGPSVSWVRRGCLLCVPPGQAWVWSASHTSDVLFAINALKPKSVGPVGLPLERLCVCTCVGVCVCVKVGCMKASPHMSCCIREGMDLTGFPSNPLFLPK